MRHVYAAILAQACNFGLTTMADIADLTYRQLAWTTDWYLREETLKAAFSALVDFQHQLPLAEAWGGGTLSSSDGQRFPVRGSAENATALPKYFGLGRGLTFYTWTSDQYSQYGSKVISSTVRDATYVLDEILDNQTDLPDQHPKGPALGREGIEVFDAGANLAGVFPAECPAADPQQPRNPPGKEPEGPLPRREREGPQPKPASRVAFRG